MIDDIPEKVALKEVVQKYIDNGGCGTILADVDYVLHRWIGSERIFFGVYLKGDKKLYKTDELLIDDEIEEYIMMNTFTEIN